jgi:hypothetical protein
VALFSCDEPTCPENQNKPCSGAHIFVTILT